MSVIELSSQIILHSFNSPAWLKKIQKANAALANLSPERKNQRQPGEAFVWSSNASDAAFTQDAIKIRGDRRSRSMRAHGGQPLNNAIPFFLFASTDKMPHILIAVSLTLGHMWALQGHLTITRSAGSFQYPTSELAIVPS